MNSTPISPPISAYGALGVSATKDDVHKAVDQLDAGLFPDAFCRIADDILTGDPDWCCCLHADDAGTKAIVAYLQYRETGDAGWLAGLAQDSFVMNLDDLLCIGAVGPFVLSNTINRHSKLVGGDALAAIIGGYESFCNQLRQLGFGVAATGGETADMNDSVRTLIVGANLMTRLRRDQVVDNGRIQPCDVIVGLSSTGKAAYEDAPNSGIGDNGLTLARHALLHRDHLDRHPEAVAPDVDRSIAHRGPFRLDDLLPGTSFTVAEALLSPTRTYAPIVRDVLAELGRDVHGIIHCTGGGQTKCLRFGGRLPDGSRQPIRFVKNGLFDVPPLFAAIQKHGDVPWKEMYQTFNTGHRMELFVPEPRADAVIAAAERRGVEARVVGRCEASDGTTSSVILKTVEGEFDYRI